MKTSTTSTNRGPVGQYLVDPNKANRIALHATLAELMSVLSYAVVVAAGLLVGSVVVLLVRRQRVCRLAAGGSVLEVALPPQVAMPAATLVWTALHDLLRPRWRRLLEGQPYLSFEIVWSGPALTFRFWVPKTISVGVVRRAVETAWPGSAVTEARIDWSFDDASVVLGGGLRLSGKEWFSLKTDHDADPLNMVLGAVEGMSISQGAVVQVLVRPVTGKRMARCHRAARALRTGRSPSVALRILDLLTPGPVGGSGDELNRAADVRAILVKGASLGWEAAIRYGVFDTDGGNRRRSGELVSQAHSLACAFAVYSGRIRLRRTRLGDPGRVIRQRRLFRGDLLSVEELAALAHLPADASIAGLVRAGARAVVPSPGLPLAGKVFGDSETGNRRAVALRPEDGRYHVHVLGSTGSGKSTLLTNLVLGDVKAGRGVVVIDPKGDLIVEILEQLPLEAASRLRLLDPANKDLAPALDILGGEDHHLVVDNVVGIFRRIFEAYWGPRTDDLLRSACHTLLARKGNSSSLAEVPLLLSNAEFRKRITSDIGKGSELGLFWSSYESMSEAQRAQLIGPVMNKLRAFLLRDFVKRVVGNGSNRLDMSEVLNGGIFLVRIPKGTVGDETAALIGSLIVAKVWQAATLRSQIAVGERRDAVLYVDECQNFLNLPRSFDDILAEARGYGVSLVMAHQHLGQLSRELRDAMSSNARNKVFFNMSPEDAHVLDKHFAPELSAHDLSHLGAYQAALRLVANGQEQPACTVRTRPPAESRRDGGAGIVSRMEVSVEALRDRGKGVGLDPYLVDEG